MTSSLFERRTFDSLAGVVKSLPDSSVLASIQNNPVADDFIMPSIPKTPYAIYAYYKKLCGEYGYTDAMPQAGCLRVIKRMKTDFGFDLVMRSIAFHVINRKKLKAGNLSDIEKRTRKFIEVYFPERLDDATGI